MWNLIHNKLFAVELLLYTYMSILTHGGLKGSGKLQLQRLPMLLIELSETNAICNF